MKIDPTMKISSIRIFTLASLLLLAAIIGASGFHAAKISAAPSVATPPETPADSLLILSKTDHTLAIVDPSTLQVIARVPVGNDPHEVIASTDGQTAYVSNYGSGAYNTLAVVDLVAQKALPSIDLGALRGPHGLFFTGGKVWFTAEAAKAIGSYDPATKSIDWIFGTGQNRTHMIYVWPDLNRIATTNVSSATVSIIEKVAAGAPGRGASPNTPSGVNDDFRRGTPPGIPSDAKSAPPPGLGGTSSSSGSSAPPLPPPQTRGGPPPQSPPPQSQQPPPGRGPQGPPGGDWNQTVIPVGSGSEGFDVSPDGKEIWVANAGDGTISIIDVASKSVTQTLAADVRGANRLKFTPDGKRVLVAGLGGGPGIAQSNANAALTVIDAATRKTIQRIAVGRGAAGIVMQPDGARAFVACSPDNYVAVINLATLEVVGHIDAGGNPDGLAWARRR
jgi:YVTN family beta-propeller protein